MKITTDVWKQLLELPHAPPECGGILGGKEGIVNVFCYDHSGPLQEAIYTPNVTFLNRVIEEWHRDGISFCGIVHTHMAQQSSLSQGDIDYIHAVMATMNVGDKLYFPIVSVGTVVVYAAVKTESSVIIEQEEPDVLLL